MGQYWIFSTHQASYHLWPPYIHLPSHSRELHLLFSPGKDRYLPLLLLSEPIQIQLLAKATHLPPTLYTIIPVSPVLHHMAVLLSPTQLNTPTAPRGISPWVMSLSTPWLHATLQQSAMMLLASFMKTCEVLLKKMTGDPQLNTKIIHLLKTTFWHN